jgi:short-subunit dehydrogenase
MKILITGTSSGIGKAIALKLISEQHEVYGISRTSADINSSFFHEYLLDLTNIGALENLVKQLNKEISFDVLINNAGCGYYGLHEELNTAKIHEMITTNLEVPMVLCNLLMRTLKSNGGCIINISSVTAKQHNPHGAA